MNYILYWGSIKSFILYWYTLLMWGIEILQSFTHSSSYWNFLYCKLFVIVCRARYLCLFYLALKYLFYFHVQNSFELSFFFLYLYTAIYLHCSVRFQFRLCCYRNSVLLASIVNRLLTIKSMLKRRILE